MKVSYGQEDNGDEDKEYLDGRINSMSVTS
jgi:hypothetical protein